MKKLIFGLLLAWGACFGQSWNYTGWLDTLSDTGFIADTTIYFGALPLSQYEDIALVVMADDTTSDGFASDSIGFYYGYQVGYPVLNSSEGKDTAWSERIVIDTMLTDSLGVENLATTDAVGAITATLSNTDTLSVSGYATQCRWFVPRWGVVIRFWVTGLASNLTGEQLDFRMTVERRVALKVRDN